MDGRLRGRVGGVLDPDQQLAFLAGLALGMTRESFTTTISRDFFDLMLDDHLGGGVGREVYAMKHDPTLVVKFETGAGSFQNIIEWETWRALEYHKPSAKWLAPCVSISPCGTVLVQKRTTVIREAELPSRVPAWATDLKLENWGLLDGNPVIHDYGYSSLISRGAVKGLKKADWHI